MITEFVNDDGSLRKVWIRMTSEERKKIRNARLLANFIIWKTPAQLMGEELEGLVCGHKPERYITLTDWP